MEIFSILSNVIIALIIIILLKIYWQDIANVWKKKYRPKVISEEEFTIARIHKDSGYRAISLSNGESIKDKFGGFSIWDNSCTGDKVCKTTYTNGKVKYKPTAMSRL